MLTLILTVATLNVVHHSPLLAVCAVFTATAAYLQSTFVSAALCCVLLLAVLIEAWVLWVYSVW